MTDEIARLREILDRYGPADISVPFPAFGDSPVWHVNVRQMITQGLRQDSAEEWRADALASAELLIAVLAESLWILTRAPRIEFSGHLRQATVTLDGKLVVPPEEGALKCEVSLELDRLTGKAGGVVSRQCAGMLAHLTGSRSA